MSKRAREYVVLVAVILVGIAYGWVSRDWSYLELMGGIGVIGVVVACVGMPWIESAPDGAWRRRPQS
jgi:CHASE2 domain-containing sensor protein